MKLKQHQPFAGGSAMLAADASGSFAIPESGLKDFVLALAVRYQIGVVKTYADQWAETVTRLADDEVHTDATEELVIALKKAHRIDNAQMVQMLANYLREKARV